MAKKRKPAHGSGFGQAKGPPQKNVNVHYNFWGMLAHIGLRMVDRGQAIFFLLFILILAMILKMPGDNVVKIWYDVLDGLANFSLAGYLLFTLTTGGWFFHARWQRRIIGREMHRIGREKSEWQEKAMEMNLGTSLKGKWQK